MSHTLRAHFRVEPTQNMIYWWPLVFEVMQRRSLGFYHPDWERGTVQYYYVRRGNPSDSDSVTKPFKNLWDEICSNMNEGILDAFWSKGKDYYNIEISMQTNLDDQVVSINLSFEGAYVMHEATSIIKKRLRRVSDIAVDLYEICKPCIGELYWTYAGDEYAPWASFGTLPDALSHNRAIHVGPERKLVQRKLPKEDRATGRDGIYFLDPVPVPNGRGWSFVSLMNGEVYDKSRSAPSPGLDEKNGS